MTNEKIKAALDWIGDIHANIMIAFATAEQSHEAHKEAGKAISAIETLRALLEAKTSAGEEIAEIEEWLNELNISVSKGLVENIQQDAKSNETTLRAKKNRQVLLKQSAEALQSFIDFYESSRRYAASQQTRGAVPEGWITASWDSTKWKLVPVPSEMTDDQAEAISKVANCCGGIAYEVYDAALTASPTPPVAGKEMGE